MVTPWCSPLTASSGASRLRRYLQEQGLYITDTDLAEVAIAIFSGASLFKVLRGEAFLSLKVKPAVDRTRDSIFEFRVADGYEADAIRVLRLLHASIVFAPYVEEFTELSTEASDEAKS
ncbi:hypothetical protein HGA91_00430 [candidate division WWE3 bacterium]|nr:hypothetical protein [candidate division WWE3 bacterium]